MEMRERHCKLSHIFQFRPAGGNIYLGRLGGERDGDGSYTYGVSIRLECLHVTTSRLLADMNPGNYKNMAMTRIKTAELLIWNRQYG